MANLIALKADNNDYVLQTRKWDPDTGAEVEPQEQLLSLTMLRQQHANLASEMDNVAALIADLEAFVEENPVAPVVVI
ncbi:MAG: hypothetical protein Q7O66_17435, partial [Dehalococcoidia bacterium]|nr:hypothetical protein [Dehalococcoidia bacterium]